MEERRRAEGAMQTRLDLERQRAASERLAAAEAAKKEVQQQAQAWGTQQQQAAR
jgi:hypothetical protein